MKKYFVCKNCKVRNISRRSKLKESIQKLTDDFIITHDIDKFDQALLDLFVSYADDLIGDDEILPEARVGYDHARNALKASMREKLEGWVT